MTKAALCAVYVDHVPIISGKEHSIEMRCKTNAKTRKIHKFHLRIGWVWKCAGARYIPHKYLNYMKIAKSKQKERQKKQI